MTTRFFAFAIISLFALGAGLTGCKGGEAVEKLGELKDKTCSCDGDQDCLDEAKTMAEDWAKEYADARGGDKEEAEKHMTGILECAPSVGLALAAAVEENSE